VSRFDEGEEEQEKKVEAPTQPSPATMSLFKARTIVLFGEIDQKSAERAVAQLLALDADNHDPIRMFLSSPGGHVESGDAIHDVIRYVAAPVKMIGTGWVASAGAHIFLSAKRENRFCLRNTRFLLHQPWGGVGGPASDISIEAREMIKMRERLNRVIARETGQPLERVIKDTDRNFWMSPEEARDYGLVTHVIERADEVK
jgi:ATP-dependent Clp protease protease subunit